MLTKSWLIPMHPFVKQHDTPVVPVVEGATDTVTYHSGIVINRTYGPQVTGDDYFESSVKVTVAGMEGLVEGYARTTMQLRDTGMENKCEATVTIERGVEWSQEEKELTELYLNQMLQGFAYYIETGKAVVRNQFGLHPIYSPAINDVL